MENSNTIVHPNVAAAQLGVSINCVYEWIRRGELRAERREGQWLVVLDATAAVAGSDRFPESTSPTSPNYPLPPVEPQAVASAHSPVMLLPQPLTDPAPTYDRASIAQTHVVPVNADMHATQSTDGHRRSRVIMLAIILALVLGGNAIQTSSAQRSDDLTVAFVFICGVAVGGIAASLARQHHES